MKARGRLDLTPLEAAAIAVICFGWTILFSIEAVASGFTEDAEFSDRSMIGIVISEVLFALVALTVLRSRNYAIETLYPTPSGKGALTGAAVYVAATGAGWILSLAFSSGQATQPVETALAGSTVSLPIIITTAVINGTFEEVFLLGVLQRGLRAYGPTIAIGASMLVRISFHLYQGSLGAVSILGFGLVLSLYYLRTEKLFPVVFAHILADIVPFLLLPDAD